MKKTLLLFAALLLTHLTYSQVPNLDLEQWTDFGQYMEPSGEWTTANKIVLLSGFNPVTTTRVTDAHGGTYAAKIETDEIQFLGTLVSGTLALGEFDQGALPPNNLKQGIPYPYSTTLANFTGWYKFTSVNSDSCTIYCWLFKYNTTTGDRDTVAFAGFTQSTSVSSYTMWDEPFNYFSTDTPDSMSIVIASSKEGDIFQGQVGNAVWVDDIQLGLSTGLVDVLTPEVKVTAFPNPSSDVVRFSWERNLLEGSIQIYSLDGKLVMEKSVVGQDAEADISDLPRGSYHFLLNDQTTALYSGSFLVQ